MERKHNASLTEYARELRKNMTEEERILWFRYLRDHPARFQRQKVLGKYIADFYSASASLVVELDGSQHFEDSAVLHDADRTRYLEQYGLTVLRIPNNAVRKNLPGVCEYIDRYIEENKEKIDQKSDSDVPTK